MTDPHIKDRLIRFILDFKPLTLLVVGDLMLDQYSWGEVERISPEAPIPVVKMGRQEHRLGGAASVVKNLQALGCNPIAVGLLGQDEPGRQFLDIFRESGLDPSGLVVGEDLTTVVKIRVLTRQQQMIRLDYEGDKTVPQSAKDRLKAKVAEMLPKVSAVVLSDYAKGVLDPELIRFCIDQANRLHIPIVADPGKGVPIETYRGITSIKPNRTEAEAAVGTKITGPESMLSAALLLQEKVSAKFLCLSLDKDGLLYFQDSQRHQLHPTEVREVYDVTGAGDMVVTILAVMLAAGAEPELAFPMANLAAELEIGHMGVVPLPWSEILARIESGESLVKLRSLPFLLKETPDAPSSWVFTNGYFDRIHAGHLRFLLEAGKIPGRLVVAINSDRTITRQRGSEPLLGEMDRVRLLASLVNVDRILIFDQEDASELILALKPKVVVKGENFRGETLPEAQAIATVGAQVVYIPHFPFS
ncbi:MAG: hypothetical protein A2600_08330 [Candidatus Lambdaproteobacteria bacterium RIFOXYD1_FULL_56_27]|uniref:Uncharacterized protein n=1 Tax=Candidatus Lambdaproteobacteria bacterium RIFOXYD2_FULL_56_26 TaxID=1817773 RepID=A0A1F6H0E5_9PROT|nr:MAG: hypothetical protein A2426_06750 [Candidatus Lambdaproteobacteria bacterium RIFOXYC1_FULL_56_13]OGH03791.1 MAG: hypothetical protein A2557_13655 [Candidatus Lambdaproteobacteria bacterium RIFOXYD2_FULL_56_26]OGH08786.1 MAG: hypothetical protein A2600_08330 [Candidatus Lambdaproteobacteria bacterium RIFOXYD1_FULL_56_27]